jgi:hypothetical protein
MARKTPTLSSQVIEILESKPGNFIADSSGCVNGQIRSILSKKYKRKVHTNTLSITLRNMENEGLVVRQGSSKRTYTLALNKTFYPATVAPKKIDTTEIELQIKEIQSDIRNLIAQSVRLSNSLMNLKDELTN